MRFGALPWEHGGSAIPRVACTSCVRAALRGNAHLRGCARMVLAACSRHRAGGCSCCSAFAGRAAATAALRVVGVRPLLGSWPGELGGARWCAQGHDGMGSRWLCWSGRVRPACVAADASVRPTPRTARANADLNATRLGQSSGMSLDAARPTATSDDADDRDRARADPNHDQVTAVGVSTARAVRHAERDRPDRHDQAKPIEAVFEAVAQHTAFIGRPTTRLKSALGRQLRRLRDAPLTRSPDVEMRRLAFERKLVVS
jgi:hypothetical protein